MQENHKIMTDLGRVNDYDYSRPTRLPGRINLTSYGAAKYVLTHQDLFHVTWGDGFEWIWGKGGRAFMLSGDGPGNAQNKKTMATALYKDKWEKEVKEFYEYITLKLLHEKSFKLAGVNEVDITRDVGNLAHIHFASNVFSLPLKTEEHPRGIYTEHEMYQLMALMFICIFFDLDPVKSFALRQAAKTLVGQLTKVVEAHVKTVNMTGLVAGIADTFMANDHYLKDYGVHMVRKLLATGMTPEEVTYSQIMPTAGAMVANQAQVFTQCLDFYLSDKGKPYLPEINRLAKMNTPEADRKILGYAMEGIRLNGTFGLYRKATKDCTVDDGSRGNIAVPAGGNVFVSFVGAAKDPVMFPSPESVNPERPFENYIHYGEGAHQCLGKEISMIAMQSMLKVVGGLDNLRRAKGPRGELKKIPREGGFYIYMTEDGTGYFPFPTTMRVNWDGKLPSLPKRA
jgi:linoleate 10R-lipoxygenase